ncbi:MAG: hypothetical protein IJO40_02900, partial [Thermoguttaceae bacterium]|nr:hypothetical protein [Thermoguttaceae bacterium]
RKSGTDPEPNVRKPPGGPSETDSAPNVQAARIAADGPNRRETSRAFDLPLALAALSAYNVEKRRERFCRRAVLNVANVEIDRRLPAFFFITVATSASPNLNSAS